MRLICPNCSTEYAVPEDMIPDAGRDVQCEECLHVWHQAPLPAIKRPPLDPYVAAVLRAEATREAAVRAGARYDEDSDDTAAPVIPSADQSPEDIATDQPAPEFRPAAEVLAQIEAHNNEGTDQDAVPEPHQDETPSSASPDQATVPAAAAVQLHRERRAFTAGFSFVLVLAMIIGLAYANAPLISARVPSLAAGLTVAVARIDLARTRLDHMVMRIIGRAGA